MVIAKRDLRAGHGIQMVVALHQADPSGDEAVCIDDDAVLVMVWHADRCGSKKAQVAFVDAPGAGEVEFVVGPPVRACER